MLAAIRKQSNIVICGVPVFEVKSNTIEEIADKADVEGVDMDAIESELVGVNYRIVSAGSHLVEPAIRRGPGSRAIRFSADDYAAVLRRKIGDDISPDDEDFSAGGKQTMRDATPRYGIITFDPAVPNRDGKATIDSDSTTVRRTAKLLGVRTAIPCNVREGPTVYSMVPKRMVEQELINVEILERLRGVDGEGLAAAAAGGGGD